jgi:hypothetical protein
MSNTMEIFQKEIQQKVRVDNFIPPKKNHMQPIEICKVF